jgi:hypothetical protein
MINMQQQQENNGPAGDDATAADTKSKLEKLKQQWYHSCPCRLYDLCIQVLVKNVHTTLLVPSFPSKQQPSAVKSVLLKSEKSDDQLPVIAESTSMSKRTKIPLQESSLVNNSSSTTIKLKSSDMSNKKSTKSNKSKKKKKDKNRSDAVAAATEQSKSSRHSKQGKTKYRLAEHVGPLPAPICHSLIKEYSKYYLGQLEQLERDAYFNNYNAKSKQNELRELNQKANPQKPPAPPLVTYYDLLMCMAAERDKCQLSMLDYRMCTHAHSTLEQRLLQQHVASGSASNSITDYIRIVKSRSKKDSNGNGSEQQLISMRGLQRIHLDDKDVKLVCRGQRNKLTYLDVCPRLLTNKSLLYLSRYASGSLKYLRLENCCNWEQTEATAVGAAATTSATHHHHHHHHHHHQNRNQNNQLNQANRQNRHNLRHNNNMNNIQDQFVFR